MRRASSWQRLTRFGRGANPKERYTVATYTYTIFDHNPQSSDGNRWPSHEDITLEADSDEDAVEDVRDAMSIAAADLNPSDGYEPGDVIHAIVWGEDDMIVGQPTYTLTHDDLGLEAADED